jgi:hypothetical protein
MSATEERRRHERRGQVSVEYQVDKETVKHQAVTQNISAGGAFVITDDPAEQGKMLTLTIQAAGKSIQVRAVVRWTSRFRHAPGMGLQWTAQVPELDDLLATLAAA